MTRVGLATLALAAVLGCGACSGVRPHGQVYPSQPTSASGRCLAARCHCLGFQDLDGDGRCDNHSPGAGFCDHLLAEHARR